MQFTQCTNKGVTFYVRERQAELKSEATLPHMYAMNKRKCLREKKCKTAGVGSLTGKKQLASSCNRKRKLLLKVNNTFLHLMIYYTFYPDNK